MSENKSPKGVPEFLKNKKRNIIILAVFIFLVLCAIFKYKIIIPTVLLLFLGIVIMINRKILNRKNKRSEEISQITLNDSQTKRFAAYFVSGDEKYISSLGNGYILSYLANGSLSNGFAVVSNRRVYFRGSCFSGQGKSLHRTDEERTVDIKDVTGSGFIYKRYIGTLLGLLVALFALLGGTAATVLGAFGGWQATVHSQEKASGYEQEIDSLKKEIAAIEKEFDEDKAGLPAMEATIISNREKITQLETEISELQTGSDSGWRTQEGIDAIQALMSELYANNSLMYVVIGDGSAADGNTGNIEEYGPYKELYNAYGTYIATIYETLYDKYYGEGVDLLSCYHYWEPVWEYFRFDYNPYPAGTLYISVEDFCQRECRFLGDLGGYLNADVIEAETNTWGLGISTEEFIRENSALFKQAYIDFVRSAAPDYVDGKTDEALLEDDYAFVEMISDIVKAHPDSNFAHHFNDYTKQFIPEIAEKEKELAALKDETQLLEAEYTSIEQMQEPAVSALQTNLSSNENRYNDIQKETFSSFLSTAIRGAMAGLLTTFIISCFLVFLDYVKKRKTMFQIQYAGGCIAFDVSYYAKAEIEDFQKQLRRTKDLAEQTTASYMANTNVQAVQTAGGNVSDELHKYADLLKDGLITQEEYDAMKKKVLGL